MIYVRKSKAEDANKMLKMLLKLDKETKFMMLEPGERSTNVNGIEGMINAAINGGNLLLVAEYESEIVGFLSAQRGGANKIRHTAYIVVGMRQRYRNKGIGTQLFKELDKWAMESGVSRLELTVMCQNEAAKHLYEKNGFVVEGIKKNSIFMDGNYIDEYYMGKVFEN